MAARIRSPAVDYGRNKEIRLPKEAMVVTAKNHGRSMVVLPNSSWTPNLVDMAAALLSILGRLS